jgi:hypothetical protein
VHEQGLYCIEPRRGGLPYIIVGHLNRFSCANDKNIMVDARFSEITCAVCNRPVQLQPDKSVDVDGKTMHPDCYLQQVVKVPGARSWRQIAAEAATETDPDKLRILVQEMIRLFEHQERQVSARNK